MAKTVKGARIRHRRSETAGVVPTIPPNDDHTTGWLTTDIYIGEFFLNTSSTAPTVWFRDTSGITQIATLDRTTSKLPYELLTSNTVNIDHEYSISSALTYTIASYTQNIVITLSAATIDITGTTTIELDNLETTVNVIYISVKIDSSINAQIIVNFDGSSGTFLTLNANDETITNGICLMWNGSNWIIISNTTN